jgi:hypothetical protein
LPAFAPETRDGLDDLEQHLRRRRVIEINDAAHRFTRSKGEKISAVDDATRGVIFRAHCRYRAVSLVYVAPRPSGIGRRLTDTVFGVVDHG